ncbi:DUF1365 domain-containing protein [Rhodobacter ferrooxidans]|uniref:Cyclopropane-fatty-acyl-phospholipid synthase n=1 Tax=Rhodobacter ferrooxidans TaxID=371731 RepID=C8RXH5_9RHOB|nr:DUF1365 domain-containing protein [Rhodobacter sp. SW2]EEW26700.1 protein of unknown function DUF1365 [Rhodobacter sp. SW2]
MTGVEHIAGKTFHGRKGAVTNRFSYGVDYVLLDPETAEGPSLFSRNRGNLTSLWDVDHGGAPGQGRGVAWVREVLAAQGLPGGERVLLLAQPRVLGHVFNPVSFWLCHDAAGDMRVVIAEVSNTFGDRHSYLCLREDQGVIGPQDVVQAQKILHVSPFQPVAGGYEFRFDIAPDHINIRIDYSNGDGGLIATLVGPRQPLTNAAILRAALRRPFGSRRVLALIHWQAVILALKRAPFRRRPKPPVDEVSR